MAHLTGHPIGRSVGLIAFYTVFVLGIGRMLRGIFGGTRYRLILDELPRTRDLVDLCEVISL